MLLGAEKLAPGKVLPYQRPLALGLAVVLISETSYLLLSRAQSAAAIVAPTAATNAVEEMQRLGMALFSDYLLPFEVTSILLLVAMVGAIVLTKREKGEPG
jgi:NADH-quinone oxidoreductase subunit J